MDVRLSPQLLKLARDLARAAGLTEERELEGLIRLHERCIETDTATVSALDVAISFRLAEPEAARFIEVHVAGGMFVSVAAGLAVPSCEQYPTQRARARAGGKKAKGNLKQYSGAPQAPVSTSSSKSGPEAPSTPAPRRELSAQEACWDFLEHLRVEHCVGLGLVPGASVRPKLCNKRLNDACEGVGIVDRLVDGTAITRWTMLGVLFELYLKGDLGRDKRPPWPIELFLAPGVLQRLKEQEELAA